MPLQTCQYQELHNVPQEIRASAWVSIGTQGSLVNVPKAQGRQPRSLHDVAQDAVARRRNVNLPFQPRCVLAIKR